MSSQHMDIYDSRPHKIRAFQFLGDKTEYPEWVETFYHKGYISRTKNFNNEYITLYDLNGDVKKAHIGDWVCLNDQGTLFRLSDKEFVDSFEKSN